MSLKNRKIQCLNRLIKFVSCYETMLDFLVEEKVVNRVDLDRSGKDRALHLYDLIEKGIDEDSIMLVSYEWDLLPKERIQLTILTKMTRKTFNYDEP